MLRITDSPFNLIKWHLKTNEANSIPIILNTASIGEVKDCLQQSVSYDSEGELIPSFYLIRYTGNLILSDVTQSKYNTTHLVVNNSSKWKKPLKDNPDVSFYSVKPTQYKFILGVLKGVMDEDTFSYFWSEYCIKQFDCNPFKWYNECRHLLVRHRENNNKLFTKDDLDILYSKVSDGIKPYLMCAFTSRGKDYIDKMTNNEMFVVFVGTNFRKGLIEKYILDLKPGFMPTYMLFKESFDRGSIRLREGVYILDYLLNKKRIDFDEVKNLFNIK